MTTEEIWKPVVGYEGLYEVSDHGRVRSLDRVIHFVDGRTQTHRGRELVGGIASNGYRMIQLRKEKCGKSYTVHNLVLTAFEGPRPEGYVGCHYDGNKLNNRLDNLRWGTVSDNMYDSVRQGTHFWANREACSRGHRLEGPNVRDRKDHPNARECKACHRTWAICAARKIGFDQEMSDIKFKEIMERWDAS